MKIKTDDKLVQVRDLKTLKNTLEHGFQNLEPWTTNPEFEEFINIDKNPTTLAELQNIVESLDSGTLTEYVRSNKGVQDKFGNTYYFISQEESFDPDSGNGEFSVITVAKLFDNDVTTYNKQGLCQIELPYNIVVDTGRKAGDPSVEANGDPIITPLASSSSSDASDIAEIIKNDYLPELTSYKPAIQNIHIDFKYWDDRTWLPSINTTPAEYRYALIENNLYPNNDHPEDAYIVDPVFMTQLDDKNSFLYPETSHETLVERIQIYDAVSNDLLLDYQQDSTTLDEKLDGTTYSVVSSSGQNTETTYYVFHVRGALLVNHPLVNIVITILLNEE